MSGLLVTLVMFLAMVVVLATGLPLSFCLGGVGAVFIILLWGAKNSLMVVAYSAFTQTMNFTLVALPMFILMGNVLGRSGIADDLYTMIMRWMGPVRGGLAMGTVLICTLFAAMAGISGAATVSMGLIALPSMLKRGYDKRIAVGCISAGGALGILIPPSIPMILFGWIAQVSVGRLFLGGVMPGLLLSFLFCLYIGIRCYFQRHLGPALPPEERVTWGEKFVSLKMVILPILLVLAVLGSIFSGLATASEAGAVGAAGSLVCAAIYRKLNWAVVKEVTYETLRLTGMIMWIVIGAVCFTYVYTAIGAPQLMKELIATLPVSPWIVIIVIQLIYIVLGMFLDPTAIIMITVPVFVPVITALGFDPVWFGVLFVVNMEMAYLTPPFGFNLFYMKGVVPKSITMGDIYRSIIPFVGLQAVGLAIIMLFPQLVLWLPGLMFSGRA